MAWTTTGTVNVTNGSAIVYGAGTSWASDGITSPGDTLVLNNVLYQVQSIQSDTQLTLASPYLGSTATAQPYAIIHTGLLPSTLAQNLLNLQRQYLTTVSQLYNWETSTTSPVPLTNPATGVTQNVQSLPAILARFQGTLADSMGPAFTSSTTLTAANAGQVVFFTGSAASTFTLPAANALQAAYCPIVISNQGSAPLTVAPPSGNTLDTSVAVLQPGQAMCVINDGNTTWHQLWNMAGSPSPFVVGTATAANQATNLGQVQQLIGTPVTSFNNRTGAVTLASGDVTTALGYTPPNPANSAGYTWAGPQVIPAGTSGNQAVNFAQLQSLGGGNYQGFFWTGNNPANATLTLGLPGSGANIQLPFGSIIQFGQQNQIITLPNLSASANLYWFSCGNVTGCAISAPTGGSIFDPSTGSYNNSINIYPGQFIGLYPNGGGNWIILMNVRSAASNAAQNAAFLSCAATNSATLTGTTAGSIVSTMPMQGVYKKFVAYASGYENNTTTAQTITFPVAFSNPPVILTNTTGLSVTASTTTLTINAPNNTTAYSGLIIVEGI